MSYHPILLDIQLTYIQLLMIPTFIVAAIFGYRRGWKEEAITSVGLLFSLLLFSNPQVANLFATLINRIVWAFGLFIDALFGGGGNNNANAITAENFQTFQMIAFTLAVILSYIIGSAVGKRKGVPYSGKILGAFVGVLNAYIVLSKAIDFWNQRRAADANAPFSEPTQIFITPGPATNELRSNLPTIFAILFLVILVITFLRLPKIKH
jgi:hypothetical protein